MRNKKAFSMVELIFVIVILGILAGVAIPKLVGTREDAYIAKGKNQIASIKNGINMRGSENLLKGGCGGSGRYPDDLNSTSNTLNQVGEMLFDGVLKEGVRSSNQAGGWMETASDRGTSGQTTFTSTYIYYISTTRPVTFTYTSANGLFRCTVATTGDDCDKLTK